MISALSLNQPTVGLGLDAKYLLVKMFTRPADDFLVFRRGYSINKFSLQCCKTGAALGLHNQVSRREWHLCCTLKRQELISAGSVAISKISTTG